MKVTFCRDLQPTQSQSQSQSQQMIITGGESLPTNLDDLLGPDLAKRLARLDVASKRVFAGRLPGERRSKRRGQSVEFDDYRNYVPGDDLRHLDWNVFARLDKFFIKLFREEEDVTVELVLDTSASMLAASSAQPGAPRPASKLLYAARLTMALAYIGLLANNRVRITTTGRNGFHQTASARGRQQISRFADFLLTQLQSAASLNENTLSTAETSFTDSIRRFALARAGSGVVVLLSDMLIPEGYERALTYLAASPGFDTTAIQILTPAELDPAAESERVSGDLRLLDIETGRPAEITVSPELLAAYRQTVASYNTTLETQAAARGIALVRLTTDTPLELALLRRLRERGLIA